MSREVRKVPVDWSHPKSENGSYRPMFDRDYQTEFSAWLKGKEQWENGFQKDWSSGNFRPKDEKYKNMSFEEWSGTAPDSRYYMPQWPEEEKTHFMMYETTSGGSPISPAFETREELAHWLDDNKASAFGKHTASYEEWLAMIDQEYCISMIMTNGKLMSGVEACSKDL